MAVSLIICDQSTKALFEKYKQPNVQVLSLDEFELDTTVFDNIAIMTHGSVENVESLIDTNHDGLNELFHTYREFCTGGMYIYSCNLGMSAKIKTFFEEVDATEHFVDGIYLSDDITGSHDGGTEVNWMLNWRIHNGVASAIDETMTEEVHRVRTFLADLSNIHVELFDLGGVTTIMDSLVKTITEEVTTAKTARTIAKHVLEGVKQSFEQYPVQQYLYSIISSTYSECIPLLTNLILDRYSDLYKLEPAYKYTILNSITKNSDMVHQTNFLTLTIDSYEVDETIEYYTDTYTGTIESIDTTAIYNNNMTNETIYVMAGGEKIHYDNIITTTLDGSYKVGDDVKYYKQKFSGTIQNIPYDVSVLNDTHILTMLFNINNPDNIFVEPTNYMSEYSVIFDIMMTCYKTMNRNLSIDTIDKMAELYNGFITTNAEKIQCEQNVMNKCTEYLKKDIIVSKEINDLCDICYGLMKTQANLLLSSDNCSKFISLFKDDVVQNERLFILQCYISNNITRTFLHANILEITELSVIKFIPDLFTKKPKALYSQQASQVTAFASEYTSNSVVNSSILDQAQKVELKHHTYNTQFKRGNTIKTMNLMDSIQLKIPTIKMPRINIFAKSSRKLIVAGDDIKFEFSRSKIVNVSNKLAKVSKYCLGALSVVSLGFNSLKYAELAEALRDGQHLLENVKYISELITKYNHSDFYINPSTSNGLRFKYNIATNASFDTLYDTGKYIIDQGKKFNGGTIGDIITDTIAVGLILSTVIITVVPPLQVFLPEIIAADTAFFYPTIIATAATISLKTSVMLGLNNSASIVSPINILYHENIVINLLEYEFQQLLDTPFKDVSSTTKRKILDLVKTRNYFGKDIDGKDIDNSTFTKCAFDFFDNQNDENLLKYIEELSSNHMYYYEKYYITKYFTPESTITKISTSTYNDELVNYTNLYDTINNENSNPNIHDSSVIQITNFEPIFKDARIISQIQKIINIQSNCVDKYLYSNAFFKELLIFHTYNNSFKSKNYSNLVNNFRDLITKAKDWLLNLIIDINNDNTKEIKFAAKMVSKLEVLESYCQRMLQSDTDTYTDTYLIQDNIAYALSYRTDINYVITYNPDIKNITHKSNPELNDLSKYAWKYNRHYTNVMGITLTKLKYERSYDESNKYLYICDYFNFCFNAYYTQITRELFLIGIPPGCEYRYNLDRTVCTKFYLNELINSIYAITKYFGVSIPIVKFFTLLYDYMLKYQNGESSDNTEMKTMLQKLPITFAYEFLTDNYEENIVLCKSLELLIINAIHLLGLETENFFVLTELEIDIKTLDQQNEYNSLDNTVCINPDKYSFDIFDFRTEYTTNGYPLIRIYNYIRLTAYKYKFNFGFDANLIKYITTLGMLNGAKSDIPMTFDYFDKLEKKINFVNSPDTNSIDDFLEYNVDPFSSLNTSIFSQWIPPVDLDTNFKLFEDDVFSYGNYTTIKNYVKLIAKPPKESSRCQHIQDTRLYDVFINKSKTCMKYLLYTIELEYYDVIFNNSKYIKILKEYLLLMNDAKLNDSFKYITDTYIYKSTYKLCNDAYNDAYNNKQFDLVKIHSQLRCVIKLKDIKESKNRQIQEKINIEKLQIRYLNAQIESLKLQLITTNVFGLIRSKIEAKYKLIEKHSEIIKEHSKTLLGLHISLAGTHTTLSDETEHVIIQAKLIIANNYWKNPNFQTCKLWYESCISDCNKLAIANAENEMMIYDINNGMMLHHESIDLNSVDNPVINSKIYFDYQLNFSSFETTTSIKNIMSMIDTCDYNYYKTKILNLANHCFASNIRRLNWDDASLVDTNNLFKALYNFLQDPTAINVNILCESAFKANNLVKFSMDRRKELLGNTPTYVEIDINNTESFQDLFKWTDYLILHTSNFCEIAYMKDKLLDVVLLKNVILLKNIYWNSLIKFMYTFNVMINTIDTIIDLKLSFFSLLQYVDTCIYLDRFIDNILNDKINTAQESSFNDLAKKRNDNWTINVSTVKPVNYEQAVKFYINTNGVITHTGTYDEARSWRRSTNIKSNELDLAIKANDAVLNYAINNCYPNKFNDLAEKRRENYVPVLTQVPQGYLSNTPNYYLTSTYVSFDSKYQIVLNTLKINLSKAILWRDSSGIRSKEKSFAVKAVDQIYNTAISSSTEATFNDLAVSRNTNWTDLSTKQANYELAILFYINTSGVISHTGILDEAISWRDSKGIGANEKSLAIQAVDTLYNVEINSLSIVDELSKFITLAVSRNNNLTSTMNALAVKFYIDTNGVIIYNGTSSEAISWRDSKGIGANEKSLAIQAVDTLINIKINSLSVDDGLSKFIILAVLRNNNSPSTMNALAVKFDINTSGVIFYNGTSSEAISWRDSTGIGANEHNLAIQAVDTSVNAAISSSTEATFNDLAVKRKTNFTNVVAATIPNNYILAVKFYINTNGVITHSGTLNEAISWRDLCVTGTNEKSLAIQAVDQIYNTAISSSTEATFNALAVSRNNNWTSTMNAMATKFYKNPINGLPHTGSWVEAIAWRDSIGIGSNEKSLAIKAAHSLVNAEIQTATYENINSFAVFRNDNWTDSTTKPAYYNLATLFYISAGTGRKSHTGTVAEAITWRDSIGIGSHEKSLAIKAVDTVSNTTAKTTATKETINALAVIRNDNWTDLTTKPAYYDLATLFYKTQSSSSLISIDDGMYHTGSVEQAIAWRSYVRDQYSIEQGSEYNLANKALNLVTKQANITEATFNAFAVLRNEDLPSTMNALAAKFYINNGTSHSGTVNEAITWRNAIEWRNIMFGINTNASKNMSDINANEFNLAKNAEVQLMYEAISASTKETFNALAVTRNQFMFSPMTALAVKFYINTNGVISHTGTVAEAITWRDSIGIGANEKSLAIQAVNQLVNTEIQTATTSNFNVLAVSRNTNWTDLSTKQANYELAVKFYINNGTSHNGTVKDAIAWRDSIGIGANEKNLAIQAMYQLLNTEIQTATLLNFNRLAVLRNNAYPSNWNELAVKFYINNGTSHNGTVKDAILWRDSIGIGANEKNLAIQAVNQLVNTEIQTATKETINALAVIRNTNWTDLSTKQANYKLAAKFFIDNGISHTGSFYDAVAWRDSTGIGANEKLLAIQAMNTLVDVTILSSTAETFNVLAVLRNNNWTDLTTKPAYYALAVKFYINNGTSHTGTYTEAIAWRDSIGANEKLLAIKAVDQLVNTEIQTAKLLNFNGLAVIRNNNSTNTPYYTTATYVSYSTAATLVYTDSLTLQKAVSWKDDLTRLGITSGLEYTSVTIAINQLVDLAISRSSLSTFNGLAVIRNNNWTTKISTTKPTHWLTATYASYNFGVLINNSLLTSSNTGTWYNATTGIENKIAKDYYYNCLMYTVTNSGYNALAVLRNTNMPTTINAMATKFYKKTIKMTVLGTTYTYSHTGTYLEAIIWQAYATKGGLEANLAKTAVASFTIKTTVPANFNELINLALNVLTDDILFVNLALQRFTYYAGTTKPAYYLTATQIIYNNYNSSSSYFSSNGSITKATAQAWREKLVELGINSGFEYNRAQSMSTYMYMYG